ncbi:hypothetical protein [Frankia casuarinae]|uniref:hypothetical protein n=1 Tax=Frankia casuarinae (strain DSM 45818 / CECT 9043 / HFP020203 / CcI3) TaxID=106370 RepID=UPI0010546353|nr:hypothetical protein [Frankia casuarinae]
MASTPVHGGTDSMAMPPYRALLVVDIKDFSGYPGRWHEDMTRAVPDILTGAFARSGWSESPSMERFSDTTGDGYVLGFEPSMLPLLVHPFLDNLQQELEYRNKVAPVAPAAADRTLRMRVSLHVGSTTDSGTNRLGDGSGAARIALHRQLDAAAVRHLLEDSNPRTTLVAAILSSRAYEDAVLSGYSGLDDSLFVKAPVEVKTYRDEAYLYVPRPSGGLLHRGFRVPEVPAAPSRAAAEASTPSDRSRADLGQSGATRNISGIRNIGGISNVGGSVFGDNRPQTHVGIGDINTASGPIRTTRRDTHAPRGDQQIGPRTEHHGPEHYGQGHQFAAPLDRPNFGDSNFTQGSPTTAPDPGAVDEKGTSGVEGAHDD